LEFQIEKREDNSSQLKYVPQRLYHRYARSTFKEDIEAFTEKFIRLLTDDDKIDSVYLAHVQSGKAHAFAARRLDPPQEGLTVLSSCYILSCNNAYPLSFKHTQTGEQEEVVITRQLAVWPQSCT